MKIITRNSSKQLLSFILVLALAASVHYVLSYFVVGFWALVGLSFLLVKILRDLLYWLVARENLFFYFEDYLKDTLLFLAVAAVAIGLSLLVREYVGGVLWQPLLVAGLTWVWRR